MKKIKGVQTYLEDGKINCRILLADDVTNAEFAYYVYRNGQKIYTHWYTRKGLSPWVRGYEMW
jgi:hypothetical protein